MDYRDVLPAVLEGATLVGRVFDPATGGPRVVAVSGDGVVDLPDVFTTMSALAEAPEKVAAVLPGRARSFALQELVDNSLLGDASLPHLLAPIDLQVTKACGVTFVDSLIERVIEEKCGGDSARAEAVRAELMDVLDGSLRGIEPGSAKAHAAKAVLIERGLWSAYLEVGIGPDPEVFTKAPVLASVGFGAKIGIPAFSSWNNPEPELVLIVNSRGEAIGATLGNDVNLRDVEGRSALLLGKAKDNNASSALGPFIRLFDERFGLVEAQAEDIELTVTGLDGFVLEGRNSVSQISRPLEALIHATWGTHHQYPDGFALYTGTLFAPTKDRDEKGSGFTHKTGDRVVISSQHLGALINTTAPTDELAPWTFGIRQLMDYLASQPATQP